MSCLFTRSISGCTTDFSLAGINTIYLANRSEISSILYEASADTQQSTVVGLIPVGSDITWYPFKFNTGSLNYVGNLQQSLNGDRFTKTLAGEFTILDYEKRTTLKKLIGSKNICASFQDNNGNYWIMGEEKPLKVTTFIEQTGIVDGDKNGYILSMTVTDRYNIRATSVLPPANGVVCITQTQFNTTYYNNQMLNVPLSCTAQYYLFP